MNAPTAMGALLLLATLASFAPALQAAPREPKAAHAALEVELRGEDAVRARAAMDALAKHGSEAAIGVLERFVLAGLPDAKLAQLLDALRASPTPAAIPLLTRLSGHRRAAVRLSSYQALSAIGDARVPTLLGEGLRDSDSRVRGACALALGELPALGAAGQLPHLFRALERGTPEAAAAIGQLGDAAALERFHEHLELLPIGVMLEGYARFLERTELGLEPRLEIVARLGEVASPTVKAFLQARLEQRELSVERRLRDAIQQTARRIGPSVPTHEGKR